MSTSRLLLLLLAFLLIPRTLHAGSIAFTFDDGLNPVTELQAAIWNQDLLHALADANVETMLFPAGKNVDSAEGMLLVQAWAKAGHAIGNHTYSHANLDGSNESVNDFIADIEKNEALLHRLSTWTRMLRFPYLKEGDTLEKRDGLRRWLATHHYRAAPVSIDTSDWYFNQRFMSWRAAHPDADIAPYRQAYLDHLWQRASYYDDLSRKLLGRSVPHVILLHTNAINAVFLGNMITMFRSRGWTIISPRHAFKDAVYANPPDTLPAGESVLWALAKHDGVQGLRYPAEDSVYEQAALDALDTKLSSIAQSPY